MSSKQNKSKTKKVIIIILIILLSIILVAGATFGVLYLMGKNSFMKKDELSVCLPDSIDVEEDDEKIVYNNKTYKYNENVISILAMGIDKSDIDNEKTSGKNGQADALFVATIDTKTGEIKIIPISRETMVEVDQYSANGSLIGSKKMQICLAYAYANNNLESCKNVCRSVSRLLYGMPIDSYVAIDIEGVKKLTNAVGGVKLTVIEDMRYGNNAPIFSKGQTVTLYGEKAYTYIRFRNENIDSNNLRMARQKQFFETFANKMTSQLKQDFSKLSKYYNVAKPYLATDLTLSQITYLATTCVINTSQLNMNYISLSGKTVAGEEHTEFYADENSVYEAVLSAFYREIPN